MNKNKRRKSINYEVGKITPRKFIFGWLCILLCAVINFAVLAVTCWLWLDLCVILPLAVVALIIMSDILITVEGWILVYKLFPTLALKPFLLDFIVPCVVILFTLAMVLVFDTAQITAFFAESEPDIKYSDTAYFAAVVLLYPLFIAVLTLLINIRKCPHCGICGINIYTVKSESESTYYEGSGTYSDTRVGTVSVEGTEVGVYESRENVTEYKDKTYGVQCECCGEELNVKRTYRMGIINKIIFGLIDIFKS